MIQTVVICFTLTFKMRELATEENQLYLNAVTHVSVGKFSLMRGPVACEWGAKCFYNQMAPISQPDRLGKTFHS